jgi:hypothetical protein
LSFEEGISIPPPLSGINLIYKISITAILSETLAPPNIATNGLAGFESAYPLYQFLFDRYPQTAGR